MENFLNFIKDGIFVFYGVCGNEFKLGDTIWEAVEDPDDGYRSYLDCIKKRESDGIFFRHPLATVKVIEKKAYENQDFEGWAFVDIFDNHEWLVVGTEDYNDYYPCFVFYYQPKG